MVEDSQTPAEAFLEGAEDAVPDHVTEEHTEEIVEMAVEADKAHANDAPSPEEASDMLIDPELNPPA